MATLETRLNALAAAIGADVKALTLAQGVLTDLDTTAQTSLVAAINEIFAMGGGSGGVTAGDLSDAIDALRTELLGGAGSAFDTFQELADILAADESTAAALATAVANRVRYDAAQSLTAPQKVQALTNIGGVGTIDIGDPNADLVAAYVTAKT